MSRYQIGFWCIKGEGHFVPADDPEYGQCGNGWPVFIEHDTTENPQDDEYLPPGHWDVWG